MRVNLTQMHSSGRAFGPDKYYVTGGIPGEEVEITKERGKGFRCGHVTQVLSPSPLRTAPFCLHAELCGGCPWQHITYEGQLRYKREILEAALLKYQISLPPEGIPEVTPSPLQTGYRNKTEYTFSAEGSRMGFHPIDKPYEVFDCRTCFLQPPVAHQTALQIKELAINHSIPFYNYSQRSGLLRNLLLRHSSNGLCAVCGFTSHANDTIKPFMEALQKACPQVTSWYYSVWEGRPDQKFYDPEFFYCGGTEYLEETVTLADKSGKDIRLNFRVSPQAFYQPNPLQAVNLYQYIASQMAPSDGLVYDLYTGIGTIVSVLAAGHPDNDGFVAIEGNAKAIADARFNATLNGLSQIVFLTGDILQTFTPAFTVRYPQPSLIVLDPPRSGTLTEIKKAIIAAQPQQIIYVSCNPVSLAWDLKQLCEGGYRIDTIRPFDMFPQTQHVETVVSLLNVNSLS